MVQSVNLCILTRNRALNVTTLHTAMNIHVYCMSKNINLQINFVSDRAGYHKQIKSTSCDRLVFLDYGVSVDVKNVERLLGEFPDGYRVVVAPCVTENVDWDAFKRKTLDSSCTEPANQRALSFDTVASPSKKLVADFVSSSSDGRVVAMDVKPVTRKLREADVPAYKSLDHLKKLGVKIGVLKSCDVTCNFVYECLGNILESVGVVTGP